MDEADDNFLTDQQRPNASSGKSYSDPVKDIAVLQNISDVSFADSDAGELVDRILNERQDTLKKTITDIISSIGERKRLTYEAISAIEQRECDIVSLIMNIDPFTQYSLKVDYKRLALEREYSDLKKQRAEHKVKCWQDIVLLKKDLRELWQEFQMMRPEFLD